MSSSRQYIEFIAVKMAYSAITFGGSSWTQFLVDSNKLSSDFDTAAELDGVVPPTTTAGICYNTSFLCRSPFDKKMRLEGPVLGNFCFAMENNVTSSYKTVFTQAKISLSTLKSDGTSRALILDKEAGTYITDLEIFPRATGVANIEQVGTGALNKLSYGQIYTTSINDFIEPDELIVLGVKTYGYKTSTSTTHKQYLKVGKSDRDLTVSLPFVEV
jgi:hypothetical protein